MYVLSPIERVFNRSAFAFMGFRFKLMPQVPRENTSSGKYVMLEVHLILRLCFFLFMFRNHQYHGLVIFAVSFRLPVFRTGLKTSFFNPLNPFLLSLFHILLLSIPSFSSPLSSSFFSSHSNLLCLCIYFPLISTYCVYAFRFSHFLFVALLLLVYVHHLFPSIYILHISTLFSIHFFVSILSRQTRAWREGEGQSVRDLI